MSGWTPRTPLQDDTDLNIYAFVESLLSIRRSFAEAELAVQDTN